MQDTGFAGVSQEEHPGIAFVKVDTTNEELGKLADEEAVSVLPTFKFYSGGKEVHMRTSVLQWLR